MRILVTGGTGFLGKATARRLKKEGHGVTVLGRNLEIGKQLEREGISFVRVDVADTAAVGKACIGQEAVIHCAALASPWGPYDAFYQANVIGTRNVLRGCLQEKIKRLVNISSPSIYFDYRHRLNIKESDPLPLRQVTHYGQTKVLADQEVESAAKEGLEFISLRPRAIFGPEDTTVLGRVLRSAKRGTLPVFNSGKSYVDMTYIDNAVDSICLALLAGKNAVGKTFNITNGEPIQSRAMFELLFSKLGMNVKLKSLPPALGSLLARSFEMFFKIGAKGEPPLTRYAVGLLSYSQTLDITQAKTVLGYQPRISLEEGFERFAHWWKEKPHG